MKLSELTAWATNKDRFKSISDYIDFCREYLAFISDGLQAVIISRNEINYQFFQYKDEGLYNITRPINNSLFISIANFDKNACLFLDILPNIRDIENDNDAREMINRIIYTCQQSIGAALDALPAGKSNTARKINGDLFERFIRIIIAGIGIPVREGTIKIPVTFNGEYLFDTSYQHDLIIERDKEVVAIGSVKTSSKDRIDKIFVDKFLYNRLLGIETPHFAVFLNDVQRKGKEPKFSINATFLAGHFKAYTVKLNPLDGVYYCDIRPNMNTDIFLKKYIKTFDALIVQDIWKF